jgi:hypothetical protein
MDAFRFQRLQMRQQRHPRDNVSIPAKREDNIHVKRKSIIPINIVVIAVTAALSASAQDLSAERIRAHTKFLSSDLLEGRGVGVRGGDIATEYIAAQFALAGLKAAGDNGAYFQKVPLVGVETQPAAQLTATARGKNVPFRWSQEFVGVSHRQQPAVKLDAEAVFVGHGIVAPEYQWDDFKGVNVKGKVLILFTNEPGADNPELFKGRALTYYGRWTYKYEQALRMGAAGCIIIHTTPTAGYGWKSSATPGAASSLS